VVVEWGRGNKNKSWAFSSSAFSKNCGFAGVIEDSRSFGLAA
jgi:hypothetical protein